MLCVYPFRLTFSGLIGNQIVPPNVATLGKWHIGFGALEHHHFFDAAAFAVFQSLVYRGFQRGGFTAAHAFVGGDDDFGSRVLHTVFHRTRREATEHHRMDGTNARTRLHGHHCVRHHRHVNHHAVTFLYAQ